MRNFMVPVGCLLGLLCVSAPCQGRRLKQSARPPASLQDLYLQTLLNGGSLRQGIEGTLTYYGNYSSFLTMAQAVPSYAALLNGPWSQGPTNNTVLVPTNEAVQSAFQDLGQALGVETNVSRYFGLINTTLGLTAIQAPLQTLFSAILNSHILPQPLNIYATPQVLGATQNNPYSLPVTGLSALDTPVAYATSDQTVFILQPTGVLSQPLEVPKFYAQQRAFSNTTGNSTLYIYEVDTVLIAGNVLNGTQASSTATAVRTLSRFLAQ